MTSIIEKPLINSLSHFKNPSATIPTLLIEACCTSGRTYQSYKRGGKLEAKERFREEVTSAIFWLWGVKALNKIGDIIGERIFGTLTDTGKDELRDPSYLMSKGAKIFKFSKIVLSALIATGFLGFVVPKINHAITEKTMKSRKTEKSSSLDDFISGLNEGKNSKYDINFQGNDALMNTIMKASYNLENNNKWRLISTDTGMLAGRVYNSRHPAERFEYLFRDLSSMLFYNCTTGMVIALLNKLFKTVDINPKTIDEICNYLTEKNVSMDDITNIVNPKIDIRFNEIDFHNKNVIDLDDLISQLRALGFSDDIVDKARKMSKLQPKLRGVDVISKLQVKDVLSNSLTSDPIFLRRVINNATYGSATNPKKFVAANTCQKIRDDIDKFVKEILNKSKGKAITPELFKNIKRSSIARTAIFQFAGMAFSAFGLAILIPKLQIFLSQKFFGKKSFEDIASGNK